MNTDPPRLRDDPTSPQALRELMGHAAPPPRIDAATKLASAAAVATLAGGTAAVSSAAAAASATAAGVKLWLILGGLAVTGIVTAVVITVGDEAPDVGQPMATPRSAPASGEPPPSPSALVIEVPSIPDDVLEVEIDDVEIDDVEPRAPDRRSHPRRASADALVVEAGMLERARAMLATHPARALAQTQAHAREHPRGQLAAEREVIAIDALRRLHRPAQALRRARRLLESAPSGIYAERARAVLRELSDGAEP